MKDKFLLSDTNVFQYLFEHGLCPQAERETSKVELKRAKNFNLLVSLEDGRKLLVKQERYNPEGRTAGEFLNEWRVQEFLQRFPELSHIRSWLPEVLHFEAEHSIIVCAYLEKYRDILDLYYREKVFPTDIASAIGTVLAKVHRATFNRREYRDFFWTEPERAPTGTVPRLIRSLERIKPEIFGQVPSDGLKFFALYQRYESLQRATTELRTAFAPSCLTHNDLKLNNILFRTEGEESNDSTVRLIDWERSNWGDPGFDLGMLIASYLQIWLDSLVISKALSVDESLRLAETPLENIQPSIAALAEAYFAEFPEILEQRPDFLWRVVQFAGLALIQQIQATIQHQKTFGNRGICLLQVAKTLLCRPDESIPSVFGREAAELTRLEASAA
ncbi:MAG: aminoglycoside phosphotransferase family protein [Oscillatoria princeps RMCB-10]|jgi:aminoglycoside phosphotransferase (APT) family kinase protein|nr:aminoglycoside phosphotransferase family protein [Oscillatoria princeps RMCB-10]